MGAPLMLSRLNFNRSANDQAKVASSRAKQTPMSSGDISTNEAAPVSAPKKEENSLHARHDELLAQERRLEAELERIRAERQRLAGEMDAGSNGSHVVSAPTRAVSP